LQGRYCLPSFFNQNETFYLRLIYATYKIHAFKMSAIQINNPTAKYPHKIGVLKIVNVSKVEYSPFFWGFILAKDGGNEL
jgi:hypothetical protein